jgi:hypothetical protein
MGWRWGQPMGIHIPGSRTGKKRERATGGQRWTHPRRRCREFATIWERPKSVALARIVRPIFQPMRANPMHRPWPWRPWPRGRSMGCWKVFPWPDKCRRRLLERKHWRPNHKRSRWEWQQPALNAAGRQSEAPPDETTQACEWGECPQSASTARRLRPPSPRSIRKPTTVLGIQWRRGTTVPPRMKGSIWMLPSVPARL